jgi:hypothetical protein
MTRLRSPVVCAAAVAASLLLGGCNLPKNTGIKIGVPYRAQELFQWDYCGPASVQMWLLYDGRPFVSQSTIYNFMGGSGSGVSPDALAQAVSRYTWTSDAFVDYAGGAGDPETIRRKFFARQITAIDNDDPVMPIADGGYHTGILNGGKWSDSLDGSYRIWDFVYFHDPATFANDYYGAQRWTDYVCGGITACQQIISAHIVYAAEQNFANYGWTVYPRGGEGPGGEPIPY